MVQWLNCGENTEQLCLCLTLFWQMRKAWVLLLYVIVAIKKLVLHLQQVDMEPVLNEALWLAANAIIKNIKHNSYN